MKKRFLVSLAQFDTGFVTAAIEAGADAICLPKGYAEAVRKLARITIIAEDGDVIPGRDIATITIAKKEDEQAVVDLAGRIPAIIQNKDWTIIPLENLLSKTTNLIQGVRDPREAKLALTVMERGADGICLFPASINDIKETGSIVRETGVESFSLVCAKILGVRPVTMGDRCCIDTTSLLAPGTGLLVGDSAKAMFLVHNENVPSAYCDARPFRVNAGAVHAYVRLPGNRTKYLSEIATGDEVLAVDPKGNAIPVAVGRNKIEKRPMVLVEAQWEKQNVSLILQNAETIRLTDPKGFPRYVTTLKEGDEVLACFGEGNIGRHFGVAVQETITEK